MWLIDANVILRYLLGDNEEMQSEAEKVIDEGAFTLPEVLAEVVYVLTKVYGSGREEVCKVLKDLLEDVGIDNKRCQPLAAKRRKAGLISLIFFVQCLRQNKGKLF